METRKSSEQHARRATDDCLRDGVVQISVKLNLTTNVHLSVVSARDIHSMGRGHRARCFIKKIKGIKIRDQPITKSGQLIIRKIIKIIATRGHILRLNAPNSIPGVCPFVS